MKIFSSKTQKIGEQGESIATEFLKNEGFSILERNIANKFGEIDIVAKKGNTHYFFEVKAGKRGGFINPAENLTRAKLRKFLVSAEYYALVNKIQDYRVQGVLVLLGKEGSQTEIIDLF